MRCGFDDNALDACVNHAAQPFLHLRGFGRGLAGGVVGLVSADGERHRAHRPGDDPAGHQNVLGHVGHGRLAVSARDSSYIKMTRGAPVELGRDLGQAAAGGGELEDRRAGRNFDGSLDGNCSRARGHGVGRVCVPIGADPGHGDEQVARFDAP